MPNYNHERFLKLRLDSILNQTYTDFELILLDDNSSDNSKDIVEQYGGHPKFREIIYNEKNSGTPFRQWMKGISIARTEYIWIAESDDYAEPEFLATMMDLMKRFPNVGIAYCNSHKVDAAGVLLEDLHCYMDGEFRSGPEEVREHMCLYNTITNASSCLIRREYAVRAIEGLGGLRTCGDWIFYARVLQHSNLAYTSRKLNYYRWHPESISYSASKTSIYISEGINVIKYIDHSLIRFSLKEYLAVNKAWLKKIALVKYAYQLRSVAILILASCKFCTAKIMLSVKS